MAKPGKAELDQIRHELATVYQDAAWKVAALVVRVSTVRNGLDQPLQPEEWQHLKLLINRLDSTARHAEQVLRRLLILRGPDNCSTDRGNLSSSDLPTPPPGAGNGGGP
ncbi:hypothetical protein [Herbaspirillum sp. VT-16-41]|uniref:hypothetical protein n=1 Tax=Herbaspirillum sp. VT-16-41 TaxID=1953765 RepID=UPI0009D189A1|nr:hypothetical protein [Herbaspirillum sp. VT-16-41]ONN67173.1 hypothetical protein BTM36_07445 [Herbaspirillum sp. VT-16-41]